MELRQLISNTIFNANRRSFLLGLLSAGILGPAVIPKFMRLAIAMGALDHKQGMRTVKGDVKINGVMADVGSIVNMGDTVTTGPDGYAVFVVKRSVYLVRDNSSITLTQEPDHAVKDKAISVLTVINGKILSVFGKGKRRLISQTAVIGIRGTAVYLESEETKTYICTCYGKAEIRSRFVRSVRETVKTRHHEQPRYVYSRDAEEIMTPAPVINHTDQELILLESMVGRRPPFVDRFAKKGGGSSY